MPPGQWSMWASRTVSVTLFSDASVAHSVEMTDRAVFLESYVSVQPPHGHGVRICPLRCSIALEIRSVPDEPGP